MKIPINLQDHSVPVLTDVIQVNESLRPAVLPWQVKNQVPDTFESEQLNQEQLAEKVIERVQSRIAELMPELLKDSVDQVLKEHAQFQQDKAD
jgi:hypothetical protein